MHKYYLFLLFIFLIPFTYAEISGFIGLTESKEFITKTDTVRFTFLNGDPFSEKATFLINGQRHTLRELDQVVVGDMRFMYAGSQGTNLNNFEAAFVLFDNTPFECQKTCTTNAFVRAVQRVDYDFELCTQDCSQGCNLFKEKQCFKNEIWIMNNCGHALEQVTSCENTCHSALCTNCGNGICEEGESFDTCSDCARPSFCVSDNDCKEECVNGRCTNKPFVEGDGICTLPSESCSSPDCTCSTPPQTTTSDNPIIILHGFQGSPEKFKQLQRELVRDLGYADGGEISIFDIKCSSTDKKTAYVATYYENQNREIKGQEKVTTILDSIISSVKGKSGEEDLTFVETLSQIITRVQSCSNADQVDIIAHSFGGLISRKYMLSEDNIKNVNKLILLATPSHGGIYGSQTYELIKGLETTLGDRKELLRDCSDVGMPSFVFTLIDGKDFAGECQQLQQASTLQDPAADIDETPGLVEYYTIAGDIDDRGDGTVEKSSVALTGATRNSIVSCDHFSIKNPYLCREAYFEIIDNLGYDSEPVRNAGFFEKIRLWFHFVIEKVSS